MIRMMLIGGFLGAGKTTTMLRAAHHLQRAGHRVAVITNDQGEHLVDTAVGQTSGLDVGEVTGGCVCCRFDELVKTTIALVERGQLDVVLAEAVGSCTDLVATVIRPLRQYYGNQFRVAPLTVLVDPWRYRALLESRGTAPTEALAYLFRKQLEEAAILALNKVDLLTPAEVTALVRDLSERFPWAHVVPFSAHTGAQLDQLIAVWMTPTADAPGQVLEIDYDTYAEAEARLAWLDAMVEVQSMTDAGVCPAEWIERFLAGLNTGLAATRTLVGHVKVHMTTVDGVTRASVIQTGARPSFQSQQWSPVARGELVVNARVAAVPKQLEKLVLDALVATDRALQTHAHIAQWAAFSPARPRPVHRLTEEPSPRC